MTDTSTQKFEERYVKLNPEQKRAVDTIEGPVMVVAGPGTGKTEILTLRIANILRKTDTGPENILALTFTEAGASNMRKRLASMIGSSAYRVAIKTFHSFCNDIIGNYPEYFPKIIGSSNITDAESVAIITGLIQTLDLTLLRPWGDPLLYVKDIISKISELKREGVSATDFQKIVSDDMERFLVLPDLYHQKGAHAGKMKGEHQKYEKKVLKNKELALIYGAYQDALHTRRLYDWSDMIMETLSALREHEDLKLILQETYQYLLVDEHQDTNNAQNKIIELLADFHENPNVFIVGDEKQAIFRFQGASVQNFLYFKDLYPQATLIELTTNYRSGQQILDAVHSLISSRTALSAHQTYQTSISVGGFEKSAHETQFVAERIKHLVDQGVTPKEIAVIYRSNREAFPMALALAKLGVEYSIESDEDLFSEPFVRKVVDILDAVHAYGDEELLVPVLHIDEFGIDPLDVYKLIQYARKEKISLYDAMHDSDNTQIKALSVQLKSWATLSVSEHLSQFLERILRESGVLQSMVESKSAEAFLGIERLFEEGKRISANGRGVVLKEFMIYLGIVREHSLFIKRPKHDHVSAIRLMTAHRSKGLEFEYVFIINVTERSFGPRADRDKLALIPAVYALNSQKSIKSKVHTDGEEDGEVASEDSESDERRLFYVAMSRAKKEITITYTTVDDSGKEVLPSPFIDQIREDRREMLDTSDFEKTIRDNPAVLFAEPVHSSVREIDREFVAELFRAHPLSVTALNNYLDCPWKYFYRNLLRIPSAPLKAQVYGTAMHAGVEDFWKAMKERGPDKAFLLDSFTRELGVQGLLSETEYAEALTRGHTALSGWFDWAHPDLTNPVITEFSVPGVELQTEYGPVLLNGKLDKVEVLSGKRVLVTDFKTGYTSQRSKNFLSGKTKDSNGDVLRQLQFYKLLLQLHDDMDMVQGIIEFLEPNDSGNYSREEFEITDGEVEELKNTIGRVVGEVTSLAFWDKSCEDKQCDYCAYRKLLK